MPLLAGKIRGVKGLGGMIGLRSSVANDANDDLDRASLAKSGLPEQLRKIGQLIDVGQLREAREQLEFSVEEPIELVELMRLRLSVAAGELEPSSALQSVIGLLRKAPRHPAAMALYQEFSALQYQAGQSCLSNSHPPPARSR